jgi:hypothetical protein
VSRWTTAGHWLRASIKQAPLAAVLAAGAALTAVGMYSVAVACGWPPYLAWLHSLAADGLGAVAIRAAINLKGWSRTYAVLVCIASTGMSAAVQAMHLRTGAGLTGPPSPNLRTAIGFWPAPAALLGAHLHHLTTRSAKKLAAVEDPALDTAPGQGQLTTVGSPAVPAPLEDVDRGVDSPRPGRPETDTAVTAPPPAVSTGRGADGAPTVLPARALDHGHGPVGHTSGPVDHEVGHGPPVDRTMVDHVDQGPQGHGGPAGGPLDQAKGPRPMGQPVDLDQLTEDQLVDHYLTGDEPALTQDQLAQRLKVSRTTAKRRVRTARQAAAHQNLRVVR